jgi:osmotically-inducible protein OsmY
MFKLNHSIKTLACIGMLTTFFGCASTQKHESTEQYVDDTVITTKVKEAILEESTLKMLQINVKTYKGEVQLSGFVNSAQVVTKAGEVAGSIKGVVTVRNDLLVK